MIKTKIKDNATNSKAVSILQSWYAKNSSKRDFRKRLSLVTGIPESLLSVTMGGNSSNFLRPNHAIIISQHYIDFPLKSYINAYVAEFYINDFEVKSAKELTSALLIALDDMLHKSFQALQYDNYIKLLIEFEQGYSTSLPTTLSSFQKKALDKAFFSIMCEEYEIAYDLESDYDLETLDDLKCNAMSVINNI